eukprot:CAMPEP_0178994202 /NCGR_PEP_ID=MMETSP0795-20121207/7140_1 /TAXON_ID=88552 /ORGANISM="Amoebophrya sp., Strain Ameob2" /LENGTH=672 /DNA_ID=CAMNT_0020686371 /DNA_START=109 /DNA_END=2127 /DNA_ORIENTATION=-
MRHHQNFRDANLAPDVREAWQFEVDSDASSCRTTSPQDTMLAPVLEVEEAEDDHLPARSEDERTVVLHEDPEDVGERDEESGLVQLPSVDVLLPPVVGSATGSGSVSRNSGIGGAAGAAGSSWTGLGKPDHGATSAVARGRAPAFCEPKREAPKKHASSAQPLPFRVNPCTLSPGPMSRLVTPRAQILASGTFTPRPMNPSVFRQTSWSPVPPVQRRASEVQRQPSALGALNGNGGREPSARVLTAGTITPGAPLSHFSISPAKADFREPRSASASSASASRNSVGGQKAHPKPQFTAASNSSEVASASQQQSRPAYTFGGASSASAAAVGAAGVPSEAAGGVGGASSAGVNLNNKLTAPPAKFSVAPPAAPVVAPLSTATQLRNLNFQVPVVPSVAANGGHVAARNSLIRQRRAGEHSVVRERSAGIGFGEAARSQTVQPAVGLKPPAVGKASAAPVASASVAWKTPGAAQLTGNKNVAPVVPPMKINLVTGGKATAATAGAAGTAAGGAATATQQPAFGFTPALKLYTASGENINIWQKSQFAPQPRVQVPSPLKRSMEQRAEPCQTQSSSADKDSAALGGGNNASINTSTASGTSASENEVGGSAKGGGNEGNKPGANGSGGSGSSTKPYDFTSATTIRWQRMAPFNVQPSPSGFGLFASRKPPQSARG